MKLVQFFGLLFGIAWGLVVIAGMIGLPGNKIIGEGEYYFIIIAFPLFAIALVHCLFLRITSRLPLLYGLGIGFLLACEAIPYRIQFQDGNTFVANASLLLGSFVLACVSAVLFYIAPIMRWLLEKFSKRS